MSRAHYLGVAILLALAGCSSTEPTEREMKDAVQEVVNKTGFPGLADAKIATFKKLKCEKPSSNGVDCAFSITFTGNDSILAVLSQQLTHAKFTRHQGKWEAQEPTS